MRLRVAPVVLGILTLGAVAPLSAQLRASRPPTQPRNLPRLLVANPHTFSAADSAAAVRVGTGMREKMESIADKWYNVILRNQMNDALLQYGYPADAVLPPLVARQLGSQLQARAIVVGSLSRGEGGRLTVEARLLAGNDQTGHIVSMTQVAGQSPEDFGGKLAESLRGAFAALPDAKNCENFSATQPAKAAEAAAKAVKAQPNHGPAEFCLAQLATTQKLPADTIIAHYKAATVGDRLSLEAWGGLLGQYQAKNDTTNIIDTYRQLILVAPNNQKVVEEAVRFFISAGKPGLGEEIANDAISRDPSNPDMQNMLATACLVQSKWKCAVAAMEQVFAIDTSKADTLNLQKMVYIASQDTTAPATLIKWASTASRKFPTNGYFLGELIRGYETAGPVDSVLAVTRRLIEVDKSDLQPVIRAVRALLKDKRYKEALEFGVVIEEGGQDTDKTNLGIILAQEGGLPVLQTQPIDFPLAMELGKRSAALLKPGSRGHVLANYVLGFGMMGQITDKDAAVVAGKSCELVGTLETWVNETLAAMNAGKSVSAATEADMAPRIQSIESSYRPRIAQMKKAYCKP